MENLRFVIGFTAFVYSSCFCNVRAQTEIRLYKRCGSNGNYTLNSTYAANLKSLFSSITTNNQIDYGFYNVTVGEGFDRAYVIALCRGDVSVDSCRKCVNFSTVDLHDLCPLQKEAIAYYDDCMLRYSNDNIFREQNGAIYYMWVDRNVSDVQGLNQALEILLPDLRNKASSGNSLRKYAYGNATFTLFGRIYALVQCTPDLIERECRNCLVAAFRDIPNYFPGKQGGQVYRPACNFRYEIYQFYETTSSAPSPSSPAVPPQSPPIVELSPTNPLEGTTFYKHVRDSLREK